MNPDAIIKAKNELCPCGAKESYHECCEIFHNGLQNPQSPEALMRSRYSAYALKNLTYIKNTMTGKAALGFSLNEAERHQNFGTWLGLDVIKSINDKKIPITPLLNLEHCTISKEKCQSYRRSVSSP